jgi:hypothetical protein
MSVRRACCVALAIATCLLAACDGDSRSEHPPGSPENPLVARNEPGTPANGRLNEAAARDAAPRPGYEELLERQSRSPARRFSPCSLVTAPEARAIVGGPIRAPLEAPQGPTCIYQTRAGDAFVTLAVQSVEFGELRRQMRRSRRIEVAERGAYCGTHGQPVLYLPVRGGRVLSIAAPCAVAREFAARAVRRLTT